MAAKIQAVHEANDRRYGSPRIYQALQGQGESVCENTVAKVMKEHQIQAKTARRFVPCTTDSDHQQPVAPNLLERDFTAAMPNQKWVTDITYIPTDEGWLYLAAVLDLYSRKIVGWSMTNHLRTQLVSEALKMAITRRGGKAQALPGGKEIPGLPGAGLVHHSDRGVQYASDDYQKLLSEHGMLPSMSRKGDCWDNAVMESFWSTLKRELVHHECYATHEQAKQSIFEYIEVFYNRKRLHSSLGYQSPEAFEASLN